MEVLTNTTLHDKTRYQTHIIGRPSWDADVATLVITPHLETVDSNDHAKQGDVHCNMNMATTIT